MKSMHFIGLDAHCQITEMAVVTQAGRVTKRARCRTGIPDLAAAIDAVPQPRCVVLEESTIADWLLRGLQAQGESVTVCDPRRNHLIAKDSDKDDPLDAEKLAQLFRGGYVKAVHHAESLERAVFKQHVGLYHDRVRQRVREANRILGFLRYHGVFVREAAFLDPAERPALLARLPRNGLLRRDLRLLWKSYDSLAEQVERMRGQLVRQARREEQIRRFAQVPGVSWIRGATFYAYLDTPWRFRSKAALWRYVGIGL